MASESSLKPESAYLPDRPIMAPDRTEIRILLQVHGGSMVHCTLPPGRTSFAGIHRTVEELWYFLQGRGQMWLKQGDSASVVDVIPGVCISIPHGTAFQLRNTGTEALCAILTTMPPWPGEQEWVRIEDHWPVS